LANINFKNNGIRPVYEGGAMQNHFVTPGKDARGEYISYYDKWDINPLSGLEKIGIHTEFGKPIDIYDRIYYKDYEKGKKQMFYTDDELYHLDVKNKNTDIKSLQKELVNRGFSLPKSVYPDTRSKEDIEYDKQRNDYNVKGELNEETVTAYNKWKNTQPKRTLIKKNTNYRRKSRDTDTFDEN